jgi:hypothetical protein
MRSFTSSHDVPGVPTDSLYNLLHSFFSLLGVMVPGPRGFVKVRYNFSYQAFKGGLFFVGHALPCLFCHADSRWNRFPQMTMTFFSDMKKDLPPISVTAPAVQEAFLHQSLHKPVDGRSFQAVDMGQFRLRVRLADIATGEYGSLPHSQTKVCQSPIMCRFKDTEELGNQ